MKRKYWNDVIEEENKNWHENKNPLVRLFYKIKFKIAIRFAELNKDDFILDFGCGDKILKRKLPEYNIAGYDLDPRETEIDDYKKIKPNKIFAMDVFEHIPKEEIRNILKNFKEMNSEVRLITAIPTETWLWRKARKVMGLSERVVDHITPLKEIVKILNEEFYEVKKINLFTMSRISLWEVK